MGNKVLTNEKSRNLMKELSSIENEFDEIRIASAFFNHTKLIKKWLNDGKKIKLVVSLRPTTDYYALKEIIHDHNIEIKFLEEDFHSKLIVLLNNSIPILSTIGSSNFTNGGLETNIETNLITKNEQIMQDINNNFDIIWGKSYSLEKSDMDEYKNIYDKYYDKYKSLDSEVKNFLNKITKKEAREYRSYCEYVNEVRDIVKNRSQKKYPDIPVYLTIDHFLYWLVEDWGTDPSLDKPDRRLIAKMFMKYCKSAKNKNHLLERKENSDKIKKYLLEKNIPNLDKQKLKEIYSSLYSGKKRATRFGADEKFINKNDIEKIKDSLHHLLYSGYDIERRINDLCDKKSKYKLDELGTSTVQELIGWVYTDKYPIRNNKSNDALEKIGFKLKEIANEK